MNDKLSEIVERYGFRHFGCSVYYNESEDEDTHAFNCTTEANAQWAAMKINATITRACQEWAAHAVLDLITENQQLRELIVAANVDLGCTWGQTLKVLGSKLNELQQLRQQLKEGGEIMRGMIQELEKAEVDKKRLDWLEGSDKWKEGCRAAIDEAMK